LSSTAEHVEAHHVTGINPWIIASTVMLSTFMELLDSSIANVSLPHIARNLSAGVDQSTWILTSYLVSNAIVLPLTGWFSKLIGRKRFFMGCTVMFTLSSLLCGLAPSLPLLVFFRVLQGAGGGGMQPAAQAILIDSFPRKKHGMAMAIYAAGALVAPAIGPTIGGWITDSYSWRWIFLINIPIGVISVALSSFVLSDPPNAAKQPGSFRQIDYIGLSLLSIGLGFTQVVLDKGQRDDWFHSHFIVVMSAIAVAALIALVWWEFKVANPVVELHLLLDRNFFVSTSLIFMIGFILYGTVVLLPILLQTVVGFTAEKSGLALLPGGVAGLLALPLIGKILSKVDPRRLIFIGLIVLSIGVLQLSHVSFNSPMGSPAGDWIISRLATSFLFVPVNVMAFGHVPRDKTNQASGLINLARNIGGSMGISFVTTMLYSRAAHHLGVLGGTAGAAASLARGTALASASASQVAGKAQILMYQGLERQAMMLSFIDSFRILAVVALVAVPLLLLLKRGKPSAPPAHAAESAA
jgi:DHA2 family multidrug resistance protein